MEETARVLERRAFKEVDFDMVLERPSGNNISVARPYRRVPFSLFDEIRIRLSDQIANLRQRFAAPIAKFIDVAGNSVRCIHWFRETPSLSFSTAHMLAWIKEYGFHMTPQFERRQADRPTRRQLGI